MTTIAPRRTIASSVKRVLHRAWLFARGKEYQTETNVGITKCSDVVLAAGRFVDEQVFAEVWTYRVVKHYAAWWCRNLYYYRHVVKFETYHRYPLPATHKSIREYDIMREFVTTTVTTLDGAFNEAINQLRRWRIDNQ
jgi:hypothetical protein